MNEEQLYIDGKPTLLCYEQVVKEIGCESRRAHNGTRVIALGQESDAPLIFWSGNCWGPYYYNRWRRDRIAEGLAVCDYLVLHFAKHWPYYPISYVASKTDWTADELRKDAYNGRIPGKKVRGRWWICSDWTKEQRAIEKDIKALRTSLIATENQTT